MDFRLGLGLFGALLLACGGSVENGGRGGAGGSAGAGAVGTGGTGTGGVGTGGVGTGGIGTGGIGTGGIGTGGIGTGGIGTGGIGTGGFGAGGSGGVAGDFCGALCKASTGANCPNGTPTDKCLGNCQSDLPAIQDKCGPVLNDLYACLSTQAKPACTSQGDAKILGCDGSVLGFIQCTACIPLASDNACQACTKVTCCAERNALYDSPSFGQFFSCVNACQTQSCQQNCFMQFPDLQQLGAALGTCQGQKCGC